MPAEDPNDSLNIAESAPENALDILNSTSPPVIKTPVDHMGHSKQHRIMLSSDDSSLVFPTPYPSEEERLHLEQQRLALTERHLALHQSHLHYVQSLVKMMLSLLDSNASQNVRLRMLELIFDQLERDQQEFAMLTFSQVKQAFEQAKKEESQTLPQGSDESREKQNQSIPQVKQVFEQTKQKETQTLHSSDESRDTNDSPKKK